MFTPLDSKSSSFQAQDKGFIPSASNKSPVLQSGNLMGFASIKFAQRLQQQEPLAQHTTLGVGGPADYYIVATTTDDIIELLEMARQAELPAVLLGGGSNLLVADAGFRGLVIHNRASSWRIMEETVPAVAATTPTLPRWSEPAEEPLPVFSYDETIYPPVLVQVDSGALLQRLMVELLEQGLTGLEWFSGIPGSVGGAMYMNMHGGKKFFGDLVREARLVDGAGAVRTVPQEYFRFGYDWSVLHQTNDVVLDVVLVLRRGPVEQARAMMTTWMKYKNETQPKRSSGCVFQNVSKEEQQRLALPTPSAGYIIDKLLHMTGQRHGGAQISEEHGNFMVNTGGATAADFVALICEVKERANSELNLNLNEEVRYVGLAPGQMV